VLRLACRGRPKAVHFVSTWGVRSPRSGYAQTKWVAERILGLAGERGVPVAIYRPGLVLGHSVTGRVPTRGYWASMLLRASVRLGSFPCGGPWSAPVAPVDWVVRALVALLRRPEAAGGVFPLAHGAPLSGEAVHRALTARGYRLEGVPYPDWLVRLERAIPEVPELARLRAVLPPPGEDERAVAPPSAEESHTRGVLEEAGLRLPSVEEQLATTLGYLVDCGWLPPPE